MMNINTTNSDKEIAACYPVMYELRPHIKEDEFISRVREQQQSGYHLAFVEDNNDVVAVAGFRISENLAWGRFLYIDDLVTQPSHRSKGYGAKLLLWLKEYAIKEACQQLHLDSGIQRKDAHRFYEREGMTMASLHFVENLSPPDAL